MDEKVDEEGLRRFYIAYKDGLFKAYEYIESRGVYTLSEVDYGLEELLQKCKDAGLNHLDGLSDEAIDVIYDWLIKTKPVLDYVETLWQGESSARREIGFRLQKRREPVVLEGMDLERYGIKPFPPSGYVVTNEMINKIREELGF